MSVEKTDVVVVSKLTEYKKEMLTLFPCSVNIRLLFLLLQQQPFQNNESG